MLSDTSLLEALPVAVYTTDGEGRITFYNQAAAELWGHRPELGSLWCGSWRIYTLDGRLLPHDQCPMALTLKNAEPVRGVEAIAERPDGTRVPFLPYPTPIKDAEGRVIGGINVLVDISDRKDAEIISGRLAAIVASSDDAIISKDLNGVIKSWNAGASRIFGYEPEEMIGQPILRIIPPELHGEEADILARLRRGERIEHYETIRVTKDGRLVDISITVSPLRNRKGDVIGASKVARDITERKQAEKLQQLLTDELKHRVKNTLATVQAIATQSLRHAKSQSDFVASFSGRVQALAKAHALLSQTRMQGAELSEIIHEQVFLGTPDDHRISTAGPLVLLDAQPALHLALVLHELATNARKYGALSTARGRLSVTWETARTNAGPSLSLRWVENGGPKVTMSGTRGFGTRLIEQTLSSSGGRVVLQYTADGVSCQIDMPLPEKTWPGIVGLKGRAEAGVPGFLKPQEGSTLLNGTRILIVEDEPLVAMDMEMTLMSAGCKVVGPAGNLEQAKKLITGSELDAALLDVNLAGQTVDELTTILSKKGVPFAYATGNGRKALPPAFQEAVILSKPFSQDQLLTVVEMLVYLKGQGPNIVSLRQKH